MFRNSQTTIPPWEPPGGVDPAELVPLGLLALKLGEQPDTLAHRLGGDVVRDDVGLRAVPVGVAKRCVADRDAAERWQLEEVRRRDAEAEAKWRPPRGLPASEVPEGIDPALFLMARDGPPDYSDGGFFVPRRSFGDWLDDEKAEQRARAKGSQ